MLIMDYGEITKKIQQGNSLLAYTVMEFLHTKWTVRTWPSGRRSQDVTTELLPAGHDGLQDKAARIWLSGRGRLDVVAGMWPATRIRPPWMWPPRQVTRIRPTGCGHQDLVTRIWSQGLGRQEEASRMLPTFCGHQDEL